MVNFAFLWALLGRSEIKIRSRMGYLKLVMIVLLKDTQTITHLTALGLMFVVEVHFHGTAKMAAIYNTSGIDSGYRRLRQFFN